MTDAEKTANRFPFRRLLPLGVVLLAFVPILSVHAVQLWSRSHYQFFPAVLVACALLVMGRWPKAGWQDDSTTRAILARLAYALGLAMFVVATAKISPLLAWGALLVLLAGVLIHGRLRLWGPWLLLLLLLRLPLGWDDQLIQWLQRVTTGMSGMVLDALHIEHNIIGNVIKLPHQPLKIEEACSGVVSLMTLVATCVVFSVWSRRSFLHGLLLAASGVVWAGVMNIFRICVIVAATAWYNVDLLSDTRHAILGTVSFILGVGLILSTDRLLLFLLARIPADPMSRLYDQVEGNPLVAFWNFLDAEPAPLEMESPATDEVVAADRGLAWRAFDWSLAAIAVVLAGAQFYAGIGPFRMTSKIPAVVSTFEKEFLPPEMGIWQLYDFKVEDRGTGSDFGEFSRIWTYADGTYNLTLSVDYPFQEWHELSACYRGDGWTIDSNTTSEQGYREVSMSRLSTEQAVLIFDLCATDGSPFQVPEGEFLHPTWRRVFNGGSRWTMPTYLQIQTLLIARNGEMTDELRDEARRAFEDFHTQIVHAVKP